ncbi:MAG TPA: sortase [Mycobacteriales bacterium]|nr:sortase [Mycobacteriales bacterium]
MTATTVVTDEGGQRISAAPDVLDSQTPTGAARDARPRQEITPGGLGERLSLVSSACLVLALVCGWMLLQLLVLGGLAHTRSQSILYAKFRSELAQATAPTGELDYNGKPLQPGAPVALLTIPAIGLQQVVVDGTASGDLTAGPGHLRDTPLPGQAGWSWVLGKGSTDGAPFGKLTRLAKGDQITALTGEGKVVYTVVDVRRAGDPVPAVPSGASGGLLTLATADGHGFLSALRASSAVYVDATTDKALTDGPVASAVPASELVMARDTSALPVITLLLALLTGLVLAISVARRHFRSALVWLVSTPVVIALAWAVTDQVTRLLPNLM